MPYDYLIPLVFFFIIVIGCGYNLTKSKPNYWVLLLVIVISFIPKYNSISTPYYGTEYEDAFVFQADSKSFSEHSSEADRFRVQLANFNFENNQNELLSYTGHFTSYSSVIAFGNSILGYSQLRTIQFNLIFSMFLAVFLFMTVLNKSKNFQAAIISTLIFASSPASNLFQTSGLAETFSSMMIVIFISVLFKFWNAIRPTNKSIIFLFFTLFMCILIKRENMVVLSTLPLICYHLYRLQSLKWLWLLGIGLALYFYGIEPFSTEYLEAASIQTDTFSLKYLIVQLPVYILTLLKFEYFGVAFLVMCISFILIFYNKRKPSFESMVTTAIFCGYLITYCLHYRSRYFILNMEMSIFETFRYANNFYVLIAMIVGFNFCILLESKNTKYSKHIFLMPFILIFLISIPYSLNLRDDLQQGEYNTRILPVLEANRVVMKQMADNEQGVLVTDIPLVAKMLDSQEFNLKIHEFNLNVNYMQTVKDNKLYFLLPNNLINKHFPNKNRLQFFPLDMNSHYLLFRLK
jgi:hypothetical protein